MSNYSIEQIVEAAYRITDYGYETVSVANFGKYNLDIKISLDVDFDDEDVGTDIFEIEVSMPQSEDKIFLDSERYMGVILNVLPDNLKKILKNLESGKGVLSRGIIDLERYETTTVEKAIKELKEMYLDTNSSKDLKEIDL